MGFRVDGLGLTVSDMGKKLYKDLRNIKVYMGHLAPRMLGTAAPASGQQGFGFRVSCRRRMDFAV